MDLLFGRRKTPEELLRQNQRALARAMRELDRERQKLEAQEKKIIVDIKKMAKQGQMDAVKIMAKDLVRTRRYVKKFITMRANVQAVSLKIQTLKSNNSMAQAMKGVTKAMATMNRQLKLPQIQKIMMEFEKQAEIMDMKEELMNDAIDDAMGDEDDEEERWGMGTLGWGCEKGTWRESLRNKFDCRTQTKNLFRHTSNLIYMEMWCLHSHHAIYSYAFNYSEYLTTENY
uniref:Charged multivesicular body protein 2A n=1 Tax=Strix occidentalis caurina TaxID=311401 RepID=A0A8D0KT73_STROC